jgi:putative tryptophan/tyrosine transport system substrate-binding protein
VRVSLVALLAVFLFAAPLVAEAQAPAKVPRIGFLSGRSPTDNVHNLESFRQGLRELGYVEGQNIAIEYRFAENRPERLPALATELVRLKVDVIVTAGPPAPQVAKQATRTIPIVFAVGNDPVADGLVTSIARPGGNITGLAAIAAEVVGKQLELLKEVAPKVSRVAVLQNPNHRGHPAVLREAEAPARALGVKLQIVQASNPSEIDAAFASMRSQSAGGVLVLRDGLFLAQRTQIAVLAAKSRLPAVYGLREHAEAGGLMAYGASVPVMYRRAAHYVDKILKGANAAGLPVEQPTKFELVINLKTAKALGLTIPPSLLQRADEVLQ